MAKCKSTLLSVIRGSIAGTTFTANTFCAIIARVRTIPTNPSTTRQQEIRASFSQARAIWPTLTRTVRNGWDQWAATVSLMGPTGEYHVPGRQWFIGILATVYYLAQRGIVFFAPLHSPPVLHGLISTPIAVITNPPTGNGYTITLNPITTEQLRAFTFRSIAFTDDRNFFQGPFLTETLLESHQTLVSDPIVLTRTDLVSTSVYFEHLRLISVNGPIRISDDIFLRITATAADSRVSPMALVVIGKKNRQIMPKAA
jgi:hypothetical protein